MAGKSKVEEGSGNVFADAGLPDAEVHLVKAQLVSRLYDIIRRRKLTQAQAAKILGIEQPHVSQMLNGHFRQFSVERLLRFLMAFDRDIEIRIKPKPRSARRPARLNINVG